MAWSHDGAYGKAQDYDNLYDGNNGHSLRVIDVFGTHIVFIMFICLY